MKKLMIVGVLVFAFAFTLNAAFAGSNDNHNCPCNNDKDHQTSCPVCPCPSITVNNTNNTSAWNTTSGKALTGGNILTVLQSENKDKHHEYGMSIVGTGSISTGNATVGVDAQNQIGWNKTEITSSLQTINVNNTNNSTAYNTTKGFAGTGKNILTGAGTISTGAALTGVSAINVVGSNWTIIH